MCETPSCHARRRSSNAPGVTCGVSETMNGDGLQFFSFYDETDTCGAVVMFAHVQADSHRWYELEFSALA